LGGATLETILFAAFNEADLDALAPALAGFFT